MREACRVGHILDSGKWTEVTRRPLVLAVGFALCLALIAVPIAPRPAYAATGLAVDSSTPAISDSGFLGSSPESWASNSFSPPAGSVVVVTGFARDAYGPAGWTSETITDSLSTHLTWTLAKFEGDSVSYMGAVGVWWAAVPAAPGSMTATVTLAVGGGQYIDGMAVAVDVLTGANSSNPIGAVVAGQFTGQALSVPLTPITTGSALLLGATDGLMTGTPTAGSGDYVTGTMNNNNMSAALEWMGTSSGPTLTTSLTAQTLKMTGGSSTAAFDYIEWEIVPGPTTTAPAALCGSSTLHSPYNSSNHPALGTTTNVITISPGNVTLSPYWPFSAASTTYYFAPGTFTLDTTSLYSQIQMGSNDWYVGEYAGGVGATLSGSSKNNYGFTSQTGDSDTIEYMTAQNFIGAYAIGESNIIGASENQTLMYNTVQNNYPGSGVELGTNGVAKYNCLTHNGDYGMNTFTWLPGTLTTGPNNVTVENNEISNNNQCNYEGVPTGTTGYFPITPPTQCAGPGVPDIARDPSSPAIKVSGSLLGSPESLTSNTFMPPGQSLAVVTVIATDSSASAGWTSESLTDNLSTHLTWTLAKFQGDTASKGAVGVWWAFVWNSPGPSGMTVTATLAVGGSQVIESMGVAVDVITGAYWQNPVGAVTAGDSSGRNLSAPLTPTATGGSALFLAATDGNATGTPTAGSGDYVSDSMNSSGTSAASEWLGTSSGPSRSTSKATKTLTMTGGSASARFDYVAYEIVTPTGTGCGCAGGVHFWAVDGSFFENNYAHDNYDPAAWWDTDNNGETITNNYFSNNFAEAVTIEISYNALIQNNSFVNNGWGAGACGAAVGNPCYTGGNLSPAIYISESGGNSQVVGHAGGIQTLTIAANSFTNNWDGILLYQSSDRFCGSPNNTSTNYCTLVPNSTSYWDQSPPAPSTTYYANSGTGAGGCGSADLMNTDPTNAYYNNCQWKTQNANVTLNTFSFNASAIPGCSTTSLSPCGENGLASQVASSPSWSPFLAQGGQAVPDAITNCQGSNTYTHCMSQNNYFSSNTYSHTGSQDWQFFYLDLNVTINRTAWLGHSQDSGSAFG
jgi:hypothetical protein